MQAPDRIPVSLLTGFLGSGKTTLLNHLVRSPLIRGAAVIVNEFGEIGLDHDLIETSEDDLILLNNGCLCCTVRGDLIKTIHDLFLRQARQQVLPFDRILIETTGLADPAPILQTLMTDPVIASRLRLDGIVTVVDAATGAATLDRHKEAVKQAAFADRLLITKIDLVSSDEIARLKGKLRDINPAAPILFSHHGVIDPRHVIGLGLYDASRKTLDVQNWLKADDYPQVHSHEHADAHRADHDSDHDDHQHDVNRHDPHIRAFCFTIEEPVSGYSFDLWIGALTTLVGPDLLRVKGLIHVAGHDRPMVIHGVQHIFHPPVFLKAWPSEDRRSRIVFIGYDLDEAVLRDMLRIFVTAAATEQDLTLSPVASEYSDISLFEALPRQTRPI